MSRRSTSRRQSNVPPSTPVAVAAAAAIAMPIDEEDSSSSSSAAASASSPSRLHRLDEKAELADLNKRLEFYILRQREKDASTDGFNREVESVKSQAAEDFIAAKNFYENQLAIMKRAKEDAQEAMKAAKETAKRKELEAKELADQNKELEKSRAQLEERILVSSQSAIAAQSAAAAHNNANSMLKGDLQLAQRRVAELEKTSAAHRETADKAMAKLSAVEAALSDLRSDHDALKSRAKSDATRLRDQIDLLHAERSKDENSMEREFEAKLMRLFAERQQKMEADKEAGLKELKVSYDEKIFGYRTSLEQVGHDLEAERSNSKRLNFVIADQADSIGQLEKERSALAQRLESVERALELEKQNPELLRIIAEKQEIIKRIKASFKRKDQEFDELMDVKIMLDMEIKAYRSMIEAEEERLGYNSPARKRKRDGPPPVEILNENLATIEESRRLEEAWESEDSEFSLPKFSAASLIISGMDLEGEYLTIRNNSTSSIHLTGWKVQARESGKFIQFPAGMKLKPGDGITIITRPHEGKRKPAVGSDGVEKHAVHGPAIRWFDATGEIWSAHGDQVLLTHPHGEIVAAADILPKSSNFEQTNNYSSAEQSQGQNQQQNQNQCLLM